MKLISWNLVTTSWRNAPHEFGLPGVQLETIVTHPPRHILDAITEASADQMRVARVTVAVDLRVVGVLMHVETAALDNTHHNGGVHDKKNRAQHRPLRDSELNV
jgi:hypothetical protein